MVHIVGIYKNSLIKILYRLFAHVTWILATRLIRTWCVCLWRQWFGSEEWAIEYKMCLCKRGNRINSSFLRYYFAECFFLLVQNLGRPYWLTLSPMYIWIMIFFSQPHKEERFLFPIYPLICLCGAVALSALQVSFSEHFFLMSSYL